MANRRACAVAFVLSIFLSVFLLNLTAAQAADPAFCKPYAKAALSQVRGGLIHPACASHFQGTRWSTDFAAHYEWCLGVSAGDADAERDARARYLKGCIGR
ncbi:MAG: hypothetical protein WDN50_20255 [Bradyrhizobium sp.]